MNYKKIYKSLYLKAKNRNFKEFKNSHKCVERHHFIPKSIFNDKKSKDFLEKILNENFVDINSSIFPLTCREHYIVHMLLWKMFKSENISKNGFEKLTRAFLMMSSAKQKNSRKYIVNSVTYEKVKIDFSLISKNFVQAKNLKTGESLKVTKEEFENNEHLVGIQKGKKFNSSRAKGLISVKSLIDGSVKLTTKEDFESNKYLIGIGTKLNKTFCIFCKKEVRRNFCKKCNTTKIYCIKCKKEVRSKFKFHKGCFKEKQSTLKEPKLDKSVKLSKQTYCIKCHKKFVKNQFGNFPTCNCWKIKCKVDGYCPICGKYFKLLREHYKSCPQNKNNFKKCEICGKLFHKNGIKNHKKLCNKKESDKFIIINNKKFYKNRNFKKDIFCFYNVKNFRIYQKCIEKFVYINNFSKHLKNCEICKNEIEEFYKKIREEQNEINKN